MQIAHRVRQGQTCCELKGGAAVGLTRTGAEQVRCRETVRVGERRRPDKGACADAVGRSGGGFRNEAHTLGAERDRAAEPVDDATFGESADQVELDRMTLGARIAPSTGSTEQKSTKISVLTAQWPTGRSATTA